MKTCAFITLGCKVNQYETQAIRESLAAKGFVETGPEQGADLYVINTCTVTSMSDEKSRQYIKKVKRRNPAATVVVTGCYAEADAKTIEKMDGVDYVITKSEEARLADIVSAGEAHRNPDGKTSAPQENADSHENPIYHLKISKFAGHTKAFLKIEDGCDMYCSYCIIPYVRGGVKSRMERDILAEAKRLIHNDHKEIILTGIHLGAYGKDSRDGSRLTDVIQALCELPGLERLRLSSIEANEITDGLINLVAGNNRICPHFHVPLQSGDDVILKRMNRKYTSLQYKEILNAIRAKIDSPSFTTDVMVGFPGEQDSHFENTVTLCKEAGFSRIHAFSFSAREGTPAASMPEQCNPDVIKQRKKTLDTVASTLAYGYKKKFLGATVLALAEMARDDKTNALCGYTERYIKVLFDGPDSVKNTIVPVRVERVTPSNVWGVLV